MHKLQKCTSTESEAERLVLIDAQIVKFDEKSEATITCPVYAVPGAE
uniref:Uncharacterized protein n=1 Tax=Parascaris equorum TaxID=6256 RepID=A0A914RLT5_PAREQ